MTFVSFANMARWTKFFAITRLFFSLLVFSWRMVRTPAGLIDYYYHVTLADVINGMLHLLDKGLVHRDLAVVGYCDCVVDLVRRGMYLLMHHFDAKFAILATRAESMRTM